MDDQVRTAEDAEKSGHLHLQSGLFMSLSDRRIRWELARLDQTSRDDPNLLIGMQSEEDATDIIFDHDRRRGQDQQVVTDFAADGSEII
jgi:hypothetical protein